MKKLFKRLVHYSSSRIRTLENENKAMHEEIAALREVAARPEGIIMQNGPDWPIRYNADGFATMHNADFVEDPAFKRAYALGIDTGHNFGSDIHIEWRVFVVCWAAWHARKLNGDFVDCGVNTGIQSHTIVDYIDFGSMPECTYYLLDTYCGIPMEQLSDAERGLGIEEQNKHYYDCYDLVCKTFSAFPNVKIIRVKVPETLPQITSERIAYVAIDMNSVAPEIAAGEYLWPRMVQGALMVLDDYGWNPHINQKHAWDKFAEERDSKILPLPTGQGLLIKP